MSAHGMHLPPEKITAWVAQYFPDYRSRKSGTELLINNPFIPDDGYNLNISITKGVCNDWRGNYWAKTNPRTGKPRTGFLNFVRQFLNCSYRAAITSVLGQTHYRLPTEPIPEIPAEAIALPAGSVPILESPSKLIARLVLNWLANRGISKQIVQIYNIHHTSTNVVWPYYEYEVLVYWQVRAMTGKQFLFPSREIADKNYLYGFDQVEPVQYVIITEGIIDALSLPDQALASGGAILTPRQIQKLRLLDPVDGIILAPDNDRAGVESLMSNTELLAALPYKIYYSVPPRVAYQTPDGIRYTKDWNDVLVQLCGRDREQTGIILFQQLQRATSANLVALWASYDT